MYNYLVIGHGDYPTGVKSALQLLIGDDVPVHAINLNEQMTHKEMEKQAEEFLTKHEKVIVFADLTGGAPHQKVSAILLEENMSPHHAVISNAPMSIMMDVIMKLQFSPPVNEEAALKQIMDAIQQEVNAPTVLCKEMMNQGQND